MRTIRLILEYDGTGYVGWQLQPNGISIQQVLEEALLKLLCEKVRVCSSGRTDAGVHARAMVAAFRTDKNYPLQAFREGLNCLLPNDIAIRDAAEAAEDFDPRADAKGKHYRYTIKNDACRSPLDRLYAWHVKERLDIEAMRRAAAFFVGENDFSAFCASGCSARTTIRTIFSMEIEEGADYLHFHVKGSGFLRNMVRIIAGTLVEVGRHKIQPETIPQLFNGGSRMDAGMTAPPQGLCLMEVYY